jgi:hypothetical protein
VIATDQLHFKILAPALAGVPTRFNRTEVDARTHGELIFSVQVLRGMALRECRQMRTPLTSDARHVQKSDYDSWHVLLLNGEEQLLGCARYRLMQGGAESFGACQSALARSQRYGPALRSVIDGLVAGAKLRREQYGEAGGWALRPEVRGSIAAFNVALTTFALAQHLDSGVAVTTATTNNHSASILCRLGARRVPNIPAYYDPKYGSTIEILQFHAPHPRYAAKLEKIRSEAVDIPVICAAVGVSTNRPAPGNSPGRLRVANPSRPAPAIANYFH